MTSILLSGQTDSGKSTLAGHILYKVGYFDDQPDYRKILSEINNVNNKSKYSHLMDLIDGEILANKTKTTNFSICDFKYKDTDFKLIDTPGHLLYIRSLLEALFYIEKLDTFCLVISSIKKEFDESWSKGTSKENLILGRAVGCRNLVIVWNKMDLASITKNDRDLVLSFCKSLRFKKIEQIDMDSFSGDVMSLLDLIIKNKEVEEERKEKIIKSGNTQLCTVVFINLPSIVTSGFRAIMHHGSGEYEFEIDKINIPKNQKPIVVKNQPYKMRIILDKVLPETKNTKIIFRQNDFTIGFGELN